LGLLPHLQVKPDETQQCFVQNATLFDEIGDADNANIAGSDVAVVDLLINARHR
jgi:hypothetical protein